jgi:hypothetical protein
VPSVTTSSERPATRRAAPAIDGLAELREAIGKVDSVERAVAMLKAELPAARVEGPLRAPPISNFRKERAARRLAHARRVVSGVALSLAILMSTLATWAPPQNVPGRRRLAVVEREAGGIRVPPRGIAASGSASKPRVVVARGLDEIGAGL